MFCPNCGRVLREGEVCHCRDTAPDPAGYQPPAPNPSYPMYQDLSPATPAIEALRRHGSSSLMLWLVILMGVQLLFSVITLFSDPWNLNYLSSEELQGLFNSATAIELLPEILTGVGVLLFYLACRRPGNRYVSTAGLTMIQVVYIVISALLGVVLLLSLIVLGLASMGLTYTLSYVFELDSAAVNTVIGVLVVTILLIIAFYTVYLVFFLKTLAAVKQTARTGAPNFKVSLFTAVICLIGGGGMALNLLGSLCVPAIEDFGYYGYGREMGSLLLELIPMAASAAASILAGIAIIRYRREMLNLAMNQAMMNHEQGYWQEAGQAPYVAPPYEGQPYQGQPYQGQSYQGQPYQGQTYDPQNYGAQPPYESQPPYGTQPTAPAGEEKRVCEACGAVYSASLPSCPACGAPNPSAPR